MNLVHRLLVLFAAFAVSATLAGCTTLPPESRAAVEAFDPLTFDPKVPRLALIAPDFLDAMPNEAKITFSHFPVSNPAAVTTHVFTLQRVRAPLPPGIQDVMREGEMAAIFRLSPRDHARIAALQALYRDEKRGIVTKLGSRIDAAVKACRFAELPRAALRGSVYIKLDANAPFVPLMRDVDIREMVKNAGKSLDAQIELCPHAPARGA